MPKKPTVLPPSAMPLPLSKAGEPQSWARKWCRVCARMCARVHTRMRTRVCACDRRAWVTCTQRRCSGSRLWSHTAWVRTLHRLLSFLPEPLLPDLQSRDGDVQSAPNAG